MVCSKIFKKSYSIFDVDVGHLEPDAGRYLIRSRAMVALVTEEVNTSIQLFLSVVMTL